MENSFPHSCGRVTQSYPQCSVMTVPKAYRGSLSLRPDSQPRVSTPAHSEVSNARDVTLQHLPRSSHFSLTFRNATEFLLVVDLCVTGGQMRSDRAVCRDGESEILQVWSERRESLEQLGLCICKCKTKWSQLCMQRLRFLLNQFNSHTHQR